MPRATFAVIHLFSAKPMQFLPSGMPELFVGLCIDVNKSRSEDAQLMTRIVELNINSLVTWETSAVKREILIRFFAPKNNCIGSATIHIGGYEELPELAFENVFAKQDPETPQKIITDDRIRGMIMLRDGYDVPIRRRIAAPISVTLFDLS